MQLRDGSQTSDPRLGRLNAYQRFEQIGGARPSGEVGRKPIKCGLDYVRDGDWSPILATREGARRRADRIAAAARPKGFWQGAVVDCESYWRLVIAGQRDGGTPRAQ